MGSSGIPRWNLFDLIMESSSEVWIVLIILAVFSIVSWAIIVSKILLLTRTRKKSDIFFQAYEEKPTFSAIYKEIENSSIQSNPFASIFLEGYRELLRISSAQSPSRTQEEAVREPARLTVRKNDIERVERAVRQEGALQVHRFEKTLSFLATTASTSPFIGLFGTVLGIIRSFHEIGLRGSASLATVAPGISEALIATAAGLATAIPAVIAFNYFVQKIRGIASDMDQFTTELLNLVERQLYSAKVQKANSITETVNRPQPEPAPASETVNRPQTETAPANKEKHHRPVPSRVGEATPIRGRSDE